jgi:hypothetical protein
MRIRFLALGDIDRIATEASTASGLCRRAPDHIGYPACTVLLLSLLTPPVGPMLANDVQDVMQRAVSIACVISRKKGG